MENATLRAICRKLPRWVIDLLFYLILFDVCYLFLYPVLYMVVTSLKTVSDHLDPTVRWIPRTIHWDNYAYALKGLKYWSSFGTSTIIAVASAIGQIISCSLAGYGFARMKFRFRELLFGVVIFTFLVPPQTIVVPLFILYSRLGWIDTLRPFVVPAFLANGLRGGLFIYIFRQFFRGLPWELEDAACIDGAGPLRIYWSIMLPLAQPAILVSGLFSLVWHWNDFFLPSVFLRSPVNATLPLSLKALDFEFSQPGSKMAELFNEPVIMAASFLVILPILLLYIIAQRYFVEGIERTGLVG